MKGTDYSRVLVEFKVSHHLASSLPFPGGQWSMSSKAPWLWSHGSLCLECPSSPLLPGKQIHLSRPSSSTTSSKKPYRCLSHPHIPVDLTVLFFCPTILYTKVYSKTHDTSCWYLCVCLCIVANGQPFQTRLYHPHTPTA